MGLEVQVDVAAGRGPVPAPADTLARTLSWAASSYPALWQSAHQRASRSCEQRPRSSITTRGRGAPLLPATAASLRSILT